METIDQKLVNLEAIIRRMRKGMSGRHPVINRKQRHFELIGPRSRIILSGMTRKANKSTTMHMHNDILNLLRFLRFLSSNDRQSLMIEHSDWNILLVLFEDVKILRKISLGRNVDHCIGGDLGEVVMSCEEFYESFFVEIQKLLVVLQLGVAIKHQTVQESPFILYEIDRQTNAEHYLFHHTVSRFWGFLDCPSSCMQNFLNFLVLLLNCLRVVKCLNLDVLPHFREERRMWVGYVPLSWTIEIEIGKCRF